MPLARMCPPVDLRYAEYLTFTGTGRELRYGWYLERVGMAEGGRRRRGAELERAILRAALEELTESGYAGMTMDRVARRAGTNKNAIYRRRPSRQALAVVADALLAVEPANPPAAGALRVDGLAPTRRPYATVTTHPGLIRRNTHAH